MYDILSILFKHTFNQEGTQRYMGKTYEELKAHYQYVVERAFKEVHCWNNNDLVVDAYQQGADNLWYLIDYV
jgi:hypothetical protein